MNSSMYLREFKIRNFRCIESLDLTFNKGVNIIIGENNSGKTAIIDALRICLSYGKQWRDIYVNRDEDFFIDPTKPTATTPEIEFHLVFQPESESEKHYFLELISQDKADVSKQTIQLHFRYFLEKSSKEKRLKWQVWGGDNKGQIVPSDVLDLFYYTYLGALRDAVDKLRPNAYGNKIATLFQQLKQYGSDPAKPDTLLDEKKKKELVKIFKDELDGNDKDWHKLLKYGEAKVLEHVQNSSITGKEPNVEFSFLPYEYDDIVKKIEAQTPVFTKDVLEDPLAIQKYLSIRQNGLGENNLIFAATVLGDLISRKEASDEYYYALLIEEPEAHLHPQKQNTFFKYLNQLEKKAGGLQIFITSHSPTITAKANLKYLTVLQRRGKSTKAFSVNRSELAEPNINYLSKFLDVTKSQLFFSNGTILVEGISEALMLPTLAKILGDDYDLDKNGIEVVNVSGVAFEHFAKLYNSTSDEKRLLARCAILTDNDKGLIAVDDFMGEELFKEKEAKKIFKTLKELDNIDRLNRIQSIDVSKVSFDGGIDKKKITELLAARKDKASDRAEKAAGLENGNVITRLADYTFEVELFKKGKNKEVMVQVFNKMKKRTKPLTNDCSEHEFLYRVVNEKSEFAHALAVHLQDEKNKKDLEQFETPDYIAKAIRWVITGKIDGPKS